VLVQPLLSSLSLGDCSVHRLRQSSHNLCTEQSPEESYDTRRCINTFFLLKMSKIVLHVEECNKCIKINNLCTKLVKKRIIIVQQVSIKHYTRNVAARKM